MKKLVTMDQALTTTEQFQKMTENEGVQIDCTFIVSRVELYKIARQQNLAVEDVSSTFTGEDVKVSYWYPNGESNNNLSISFFSYED